MLVRDHMSRDVISIEPQRSVEDVRQLFKRRRVRQVPVQEKNRLVGIITDRDVRSARSATAKVANVMTAKPFIISPDASVDEAARMMRTYKIGALPVVAEKRLEGILTASDVLDAFVELSGVGEPTYRLVLSGKKMSKQSEARLRKIIDQNHGELKWLHHDAKQRPAETHLRLRVRRVDDVVTALEAAGFDVARVVSAKKR
jgi:acetoin utilization protein AcuB